jgi:polysaccharide deacetylase family protein (PEP-CTERM system associated)
VNAPLTSSISHYFTVDVEEYFQVNAFESKISRDDWDKWPTRLENNLPPLLDLLERYDARGTFFVLGWVAERMPALVRRIAAAGHEVASHGHWHRRIPTLTREQFRDDIRRSKHVLEDVTGQTVHGFRAPSFSILPGFEWAFDALLDEGYRYDSSLFPIRRRGYGYPSAPRAAHVLQRPNGRLAEFPLATRTFGRLALPAAGGGYLRQFPFGIVRGAFRAAAASGTPATFYIHPWEIDPDQPRVDVSLVTRIRHYRGLSSTLGRIQQLLTEFRFSPILRDVDHVLGAAIPAASANR